MEQASAQHIGLVSFIGVPSISGFSSMLQENNADTVNPLTSVQQVFCRFWENNHLETSAWEYIAPALFMPGRNAYAVPMCGRFARVSPPEVFAEMFHARLGKLEVGPRYNISPANDVLACRQLPAGRELTLLHWGIIPAWADDRKIGYRTVNARAETVA